MDFREFSKLIIEKLISEGVELNSTADLEQIIKKLCTNFEKQCIADQSIEKEHILKAINVLYNKLFCIPFKVWYILGMS